MASAHGSLGFGYKSLETSQDLGDTTKLFVLLPLPPVLWERMRCDERPPGELRTKSHLLQNSGGNYVEPLNDECICLQKTHIYIYIISLHLTKFVGRSIAAPASTTRWWSCCGPCIPQRCANPRCNPCAATSSRLFGRDVVKQDPTNKTQVLEKSFILGPLPFTGFHFCLPLLYVQQPAFNFPISDLIVLHIGAMPAARNVRSPQLSIRLSRMQVALLLLFGLPPIVFPGTNLHCSAFLWS